VPFSRKQAAPPTPSQNQPAPQPALIVPFNPQADSPFAGLLPEDEDVLYPPFPMSTHGLRVLAHSAEPQD